MASNFGDTCTPQNDMEHDNDSEKNLFDCVERLMSKGFCFTKYILQKEKWPKEGKHILAQYDDTGVIVYQAFNPSIAKYAVEHQKFDGPDFSYTRMSWIKTNFLWMMYRCGWASKKNQERVLAVKISRSGFETILANAYTAKLQREENLQTHEIGVRLQWDPDHTPTYDKLPRKAIQLGLKGEILKTYGTDWIISITDITDFVKAQKKILDRDGKKELVTPTERVYNVLNYNTCSRIDLDVYDVESNSTVQSKEPTQASGTSYQPPPVMDDKWKCQESTCGNLNMSMRKRCSRCNTPRSDVTDINKDVFIVPDNLHVPDGMTVPETQEKHALIEKTASYVATNGIQFEMTIKSKQGNNPKLSFLTLHDPLNFYYNHMVKMIKDGKYTPKST